jgi:hypothetical protein
MPRPVLAALRAHKATSLGTLVARLARQHVREALPDVGVGQVALVLALRCFGELGGARVVGGHGFVGGAHVGDGEALGLQGDVVGGRGDGGEE